MSGPVRHPELFDRTSSSLVLIDMQQKIVPAVEQPGRLVANCTLLCQAAQLLGIPIEATEQYPDGLGATIPELRKFVSTPATKKRFSGVEALGWKPVGETESPMNQVVLAGIETHVCVLQTAFDLLALGYQVCVPADAVSSRRRFDRRWALRRMRSAGVVVSTIEALVFEWMTTAATPEFKAVSSLIKSRTV